MTSTADPGPRFGLATYLTDHLAGAAAGLQLVRRLRDANAGTDLGRVLEDLATEIEEDRGTLQDVMQRVDAAPNLVKEAGARGAELFTRVKQLVPLLRAEGAEVRLEDLELLSLGIEGKRLLWATLAEVAGDDPRLEGFDLPALEARARSQRDRLEPHRLAAAAEAVAAEI
jgi:hypothetical protein